MTGVRRAAARSSTPRFLRVTEYHAVGYRRMWRGSVVHTVVSPVLYLLAMGLGVGALVDDGGAEAVIGDSYLAYVAPGLMAAAAMQTATSQAMYPVLASVKWLRTAYGQVGTPLRPVDLAVGLQAWIAVRLVLSAAFFTLIMVAAGVVSSAWVVLAPLAAALGGLAFSAPLAGWAIGRQNDHHFSLVFRFVVLPMFLLSGTFFPIEQLPAVLRLVAVVLPLWHTIELVRGLTEGSLPWSAAGHLAVLLTYVVVGAWAGGRAYSRRLHA